MTSYFIFYYIARQPWTLLAPLFVSHTDTCLPVSEDDGTPVDEAPYECDLCARSFPNAAELQSHISAHVAKGRTGSNRDRCLTSTDAEQIAKRALKRNNLRCPVCNWEFKQNGHFRRHLLIHLIERPLQCAKCSKRFYRKDHLRQHLLTHVDATVNVEGMQYKCHRCDASFPRPCDLKSHAAIHNEKFPFKCDYCTRFFRRITSLEIHRASHTGRKTYNCIVCTKAFVIARDLERHMDVHSNERPYQCEQCNTRFKCLKSKRKHMARCDCKL